VAAAARSRDAGAHPSGKRSLLVCPVPDAELLMQMMPACYLAIISAEW
jgi:hypothetical protein